MSEEALVVFPGKVTSEMLSGRCLMKPADKENAIKWYHARDTLLGHFGIEQNLRLGVELAKLSTHEDAVWVVSVMGRLLREKEGMPPVLLQEQMARELIEMGNNGDPRALFFGVLLKERIGDFKRAKCIDRSASMGYFPAKFHDSAHGNPINSENWQQASRDREGIVYIASFFAGNANAKVNAGIACVVDEYLARTWLKEASDLGHLDAAVRHITMMYDAKNPTRYQLLGRIAKRSKSAASKFFNVGFAFYQMCWECIFEIGSVCSGNISDVIDHTGEFYQQSIRLFGHTFKNDCWDYNQIQKCCVLYDQCYERYKYAARCWILIGKRLGVVKDIRGVIGKMLWNQRISWFSKFD